MKKIMISALAVAALAFAGVGAAEDAVAAMPVPADDHIQAWYTGGPVADCDGKCTTNVCCIQ